MRRLPPATPSKLSPCSISSAASAISPLAGWRSPGRRNPAQTQSQACRRPRRHPQNARPERYRRRRSRPQVPRPHPLLSSAGRPRSNWQNARDPSSPRTPGILYTGSLVSLPVTSEGFLDVAKEASNAYGFDFHSHAGAKSELAGYNSTCTPHPYFVSRSEFVALGCRGGADRNQLSFFNLRGEQPWVGDFREAYVSPVILAAPAAGRFVISRTFLLNSLIDNDALSFDNLTTQDITVYQNYDGRTLLKLQVTPIQMTGQNFDLSPTGLAFAIVRGNALEVYLLPPVTPQDQSEIKRAQAAFPAPNQADVSLGSTKVTRKSEAVAEGVHKGAEVLKTADSADATAPPAAATAKSTESVAATPIDTAGSQSQPAAESNANMVGDVPVQRTKPPSLFDPDHPKLPQ